MDNLDKNIVYLGKSNFRGQEQIFGIRSDNEDRFQHIYVIGQTGTGKSTLLKNIAIQDIQAGRGLAIIDPHGEFVEDLLEKIPPERLKDVIYFNPVDTDYPIGFNPLEVHEPEYKHLAASGLMGIFTKIWAGVWSARMEYILNNCILALLDTPDSTLLGIPRLLVDKQYRRQIIDNVKDPVVRSFWINEFEQYQERLRTEAIAPIQNKVGQFLSTPMIRNIVGQPKSTLDISDAMNNSKILLANVSKGRIGEDNSALIGAMLITTIQLTAMERIKIADINARKPFFLFVDEFQNFATDSFATALSEARKYRLGLLISHQFIGQLVSDTSTKVRDAIFGNVGTMIAFRVGAPDAEFLEKQYAPDITMEDLVSLPNHHIYLKLMSGGMASRTFSATTLAPIKYNHPLAQKETVIEYSRQHFGRPRLEVENLINLWAATNPDGTPSIPPEPERPKERRLAPRSPDYQPRSQYPSDLPRRMPTSEQPNYGNAPLRPVGSPDIPRPPRIPLSELGTQAPRPFKRNPPAQPPQAAPRKEPDLSSLRSILQKVQSQEPANEQEIATEDHNHTQE